LRYSTPPKDLWSWFAGYFNDEEQFVLKPNSKAITMGKFVKDLLLEQKFLDTLLPRIPVLVLKEIERGLKEYEQQNPENEEVEDKYQNKKERSGPARNRDWEADRSKDTHFKSSGRNRSRSRERDRERKRSRSTSRERRERREVDRGRDRDRDGKRNKDRSKERIRSRERNK